MGKKTTLKIALIKAFSVIILVLLLYSPSLYSQTTAEIDRATRQIDESVLKELQEEAITAPKEPPMIEKKEEIITEEKGPELFAKDIKLLGIESVPIEEFQPILDEYINREVTFEEITDLTKKIELEYLKRGIIAACILSPQEIIHEIIFLRVVEAKMGNLKIEGHKYFKNQRLVYFWKVRKGKILRYDTISRSLQMMNKNPDREVKATMAAGKENQTTDIILDVKTKFPLHLTADLDKEGSTSTGQDVKKIGLRHNNFLGFDDTLITGCSFGKDFQNNYAYHILPINYNGASLMCGYSKSKAQPRKEFDAYSIQSESQNTSVSLHQDIYQKDSYAGEISIALDTKDKTSEQNTGITARDRLRILRLASTKLLNDTTSLTAEVSQGLDALGASEKNNPLASRGSKSVFTKCLFGVQHKKLISPNLQANLKLKTQIASTQLNPQEELSLGGIDSVRGYPSGDYLADYGALFNAELFIPSFFIPEKISLPGNKKSLKNLTTTLLFLDYGWGRRKGEISSDESSVNFLGLGAGLRVKLFERMLIRMEWGFPLAHETISEKGNSRFHFAIDFEN